MYDIETKKVTYQVEQHLLHVNAVAFADEANSNVFLSGSDDTLIYSSLALLSQILHHLTRCVV